MGKLHSDFSVAEWALYKLLLAEVHTTMGKYFSDHQHALVHAGIATCMVQHSCFGKCGLQYWGKAVASQCGLLSHVIPGGTGGTLTHTSQAGCSLISPSAKSASLLASQPTNSPRRDCPVTLAW